MASDATRTAVGACALALAVLALTPAGSNEHAPVPSLSVPGWYGTLAGANYLANTRIGGPYGTVLAYGFRAAHTGSISSVRFYVVINSAERQGYSDGTGGTLRISIVGDRGKRQIPGSGSLAQVDYTPPARDAWPLVRLPHPAHVKANRRYYVVFTNVDPDPLHNYASVNSLLSSAGQVEPPPLPGGLRVLLGDSTDGGATPIRWRTRSETRGDVYLPIIELRGTPSSIGLGLGYMESWVTDPKPIGGASAVRERFSFDPSVPMRVREARVRVRRTAPSATPLQVRLETQGGQLLAESNVPAPAVGTEQPTWVVARFADRPAIHRGMKLALVLRSAGEGSYEAFPIRDGTEFGFGPLTVFRAGYAEFTSGGDWKGWDQWGVANRSDGDLQFGLALVPAGRS